MSKPLKKRKVAPPPKPEHPWERQPGESDAAWAAFVAYRDLGPADRSLAKAGHQLGKQKQHLEGWSASWDWVARVAAHDSWMDRLTKRAEVDAVKEMRKRHVQVAMQLQGLALTVFNKFRAAEQAMVTNQDGTTSPAPPTLKPGEMKDLIELGTKLERLTRGEPGEIEIARIEAAPPPIVHDYSNLSSDELRTLRALIRKARNDG